MTNEQGWHARLARYRAQIREANRDVEKQQTLGKEVWNIVFTN